ncbi:MAG: NAD(P)-dependent oxidoreductase [Enhydrobacter sp.]|nr:MAG: NAD(P)-dependent oxidoreductase [Enhydrobacter sp.]
MKTAVLGATGLVGRHLVEALGKAAVGPVVATYRARSPYGSRDTEWLQCDLRQPEAAAAVLKNVETAIVCAGQVSTSAVLRRDPVSSIMDTLRVVANVLEAASKRRLKRLVMISSCTLYPSLPRPIVEDDMMVGDPPAQWFGVGWMHRYTELQLRWHVEYLQTIQAGIVLRPTLIYGRYDDFSPASGHFVPSLISKIVNRERPIEIWGDGEQSRNLIHGSDVAGAVLAALDAQLPRHSVFNVVSPEDTTVNEAVAHLLEIDGFNDADIVHDLSRSGGANALTVSGVAMTAATGWRPKIGLRDGLADTVAWYREALKT